MTKQRDIFIRNFIRNCEWNEMIADGTYNGSSHQGSLGSYMGRIKKQNWYHWNAFLFETRQISSFVIHSELRMKWNGAERYIRWTYTSRIFAFSLNDIKIQNYYRNLTVTIPRTLLDHKKWKYVPMYLPEEMECTQMDTPHGRRSIKTVGKHSPDSVGTPRYPVYCLTPLDGWDINILKNCFFFDKKKQF